MTTTRYVRAATVALTFLAFVLRVYHLDSQSLWYDEGFSVWLAHKSLGEITTRTAADIQPPIYYYLLHTWMRLAGNSEFAVRYLSVMFGTLTIPLLYLLARRLLGPLAALFSIFLLTIAPFHVWYAQEARMYTLVTMLGVLSSWLLLVALGDGGRLPQSWRLRGSPTTVWLLYALTSIMAIYTHYYAFFLVAFQALYLVVHWLWQGRSRRALWPGLFAQAAIVLAYLPWAGFALNRYAVDESYWEGTLSLDFVRKTVLAFSAGHTVFEAQAQAIAVGHVLLALLGVVALLVNRRLVRGSGVPERWKHRTALLFLLLYLAIPFILLYALSVWRPKFNPRYLMLASPPFTMLIAAGLAWLFSGRRTYVRLVAVAGLVLVMATSAYALANNYTNRVYVRDDFRSLAARIATERVPTEAIILSSGHMFPVFTYYYPEGDVYRIPDLETLSTRAIVTYDVVDRLDAIASQYSGVWLVLWQNDVVDPNGILAALLDAQAEQVAVKERFWGVELRHYRVPPGTTFSRPVITYPTDVNFGNQMSLLGYNLDMGTIPSGQAIPLTLFWQAHQSLVEDYWLSLRLVDAQGQIYGRLDQRPANYTFPTTRWQPGATVPGRALLPTLPGTPPGEYRLQATVFAPARARNLDVLDARGIAKGISATLGTIRIGEAISLPTVQSLGLERMLGLDMGGGIELAATNLADRSVRQGEALLFDLVWRNTVRVNQDYCLRIRLLASSGTVLQETITPLTGTGYPTTAWPPGSIVRGRYQETIPADAPPQVLIEASLLDPSDVVAGNSQALAKLTVTSIARVTAVPAIQHTQTAVFAGVATLLGYDISPVIVKPEQTISLILYWQAGPEAKANVPYTVFTHLLGKDQRIYGQHDSQPAEGERPTTSWVAGEIIVDRHYLAVKPETPAGDYRVEIGLYDPLSDQRLTVATGAAGQSDHLILATPVRVE